MIAKEIERKFQALLPRALEVLIEAKCADAIEAANDADRAWFRRNPNRGLYMRAPVPDELSTLGYRCRDDAEKRGVIMLVGSLDGGVRVRIPVRAPPGVSVDNLDLNKLDDATLLAALEQLAGDDETNKRIAQQLHERILACAPFSAAQRRRKPKIGGNGNVRT
jgi:hypothetical protein